MSETVEPLTEAESEELNDFIARLWPHRPGNYARAGDHVKFKVREGKLKFAAQRLPLKDGIVEIVIPSGANIYRYLRSQMNQPIVRRLGRKPARPKSSGKYIGGQVRARGVWLGVKQFGKRGFACFGPQHKFRMRPRPALKPNAQREISNPVWVPVAIEGDPGNTKTFRMIATVPQRP